MSLREQKILRKEKVNDIHSSLMDGTYVHVSDKSPAFQLYVQDFLVGTMNMNASELGSYFLLLCFQWDLFGLQDDRVELKELAKCDDEVLSKILRKFKPCKDGLLRNSRLEKIRAEQIITRLEKSRSGKLGNEIRWAKNEEELSIEAPEEKQSIKINSTIEIPGEDFFYIGTQLFKIPVSKYIKENMSIYFLNPWKAKNKDKDPDVVFKKMDQDKVGFQYSNEQHIRNTFNKIAIDISNNKNKPSFGKIAIKASVPMRPNRDK